VKLAKAEVDRIGSVLRAGPSRVSLQDLTLLEVLRTADPNFERDLDDFVYGPAVGTSDLEKGRATCRSSPSFVGCQASGLLRWKTFLERESWSRN
jgi:hypothetical protein